LKSATKETAENTQPPEDINNILLHDHWVIEQMKQEIKMFLEFNENERTIYQGLWGSANTVLLGRVIAMILHVKNTELKQTT
jgi:hypothetical protein